MMRHWLIIYDIADPKRLRKVAKLMEGYAVRVQKSVFEMDAPESTLKEMRKKVQVILEEEEDFVVYFKTCEEDWQKRRKYGVGAKAGLEYKEYYIL